MAFEEYKNKPYAIDFLSDHLIDGSLVLFIGAGTSKSFGLPSWIGLINALREKVGLNKLKSQSSAQQLQSAADEILDTKIIKSDKGKLIELIEDILYPNIEGIDIKLAYSNPLLISISSLLMGSKRGHVQRVVTLNYDSMLEWFLTLYGFMIKPISRLPSLEGSEDVRIYHPHGFIPHKSLMMEKSDFIILGLDDANKRLGNPYDPWFEKVRQILESGVCLFIGLSGDTLSDRVIAPLLTTCGGNLKNRRPLGIWILKDKLTKSKEMEYFRNHIVPIEIRDEFKIAEFVLNISQKAMEKYKKYILYIKYMKHRYY